jgi:N-acetylmuramoyl-L-alanine amidase
LYGFNKWANENKMDAVIHVHFNDYQRKNKWTVGTRTGFAIYMPEVQMVNSHESVLLAANIFEELKKKYDTSNYKRELKGLVPDQTLIALGANGTLSENVRSVLIEYGYIYEKKFRNYTTRHQAYADMANLTATGIKDHFFEE